MTTSVIDVDIKNGTTGDLLELTMRGKPEAIVNVLVNGLVKEELQRISDALAAELAKRRSVAQTVEQE